MELDKYELQALYDQEQNFTRIARRYCQLKGVEYTDNIRRRVSNLLRKDMSPFETSESEERPVEEKHTAKVLLFDIETSPLTAHIWSKWQNGVQDDAILEDWCILCFSAKWLFNEDVIAFRLTEEELINRDDSRIVKELWNLLNRADIVIAHNLERFDNKKANARFFKYQLGLPLPFQRIDTLLHARKKLAITSNKLDFLAQFLGVEGKMETPKGMWKKVMQNDYSSLVSMDEYCQQDVRALEDVYLKLRPYIQPHPNLGLYITENTHSCPSCGSEDLKWGGEYTTMANVYDAFRCNSCGSIGRSRTTKITKKSKTQLTVGTPR